MAHSFISYSHKDKAYVRRLCEELRRRGFDAWIDDRIDYGSEWPKEIQRRLDACEALILVMSSQAYESKWVHNELSRAQRLGKPIFPLLLEGEAWLSVESLQYVDVQGGKLPPEEFYERLATMTPGGQALPADMPARKALAGKAGPKKEGGWARSKTMRFLVRGALVVGLIALAVWGFNEWWPPDHPETPVPTPTLEPGATRVREQDGMTEVYIPANGALNPNAFWIDRTEVTNAMYARCVSARGCERPSKSESITRSSYYDNPEYVDYPVIYVSWYAAVGYCAWFSGRLPTEFEWKYAAVGWENWAYPWGDEIDDTRANFCDANCPYEGNAEKSYNDGYGDTAPVGSYPAGQGMFGVLDMAGNVWEWTSSDFDSATKVVRGGGWLSSGTAIWVSNRAQFDPNLSDEAIGFRCVRPAE